MIITEEMSRSNKRKALPNSLPSEAEDIPNKKTKLLRGSLFRKEMRGSDGLKCIRNFANIAEKKTQDGDIVLEYLEAGGSVQELLLLMDVTAKGDLTTALPVFKAIHSIILRVQSASKKYHQQTVEGVKYLFHTFMPTIHAMLAMISNKHRKVVLKLLSSIVTLHHTFGREILTSVQFSTTLIDQLVQLSPGKESPRKYFILFILSFLVEGTTSTIRALVQKKELLSSFIPGLKFDNVTTVNIALTMLKEKILENPNIHKTLKLDIFNTMIIQSLLKLYDWKGPRNIKLNGVIRKKKHTREADVDAEEKKIVIESAHSFLLVLCSSKKYGVAFTDKSFGTSGQNMNQLIFSALEVLPRPWEQKETWELVRATLSSCPDLLRPVLSRMEPSFQPRDSLMWSKALEFAQDVLNFLDTSSLYDSAGRDFPWNQTANVVKWICAPHSLTRNLKEGTDKLQPLAVRFLSIRALVLMWHKCNQVLASFKSHYNQLKKSVVNSFSKAVPKIDDLLLLWQELCTNEETNTSTSILPLPEKTLFLSTVLDALQIAAECDPKSLTGQVTIATTLLRGLDKLQESSSVHEFDNIRVKIIRFVVFVDSSFVSVDKELFEEAVKILLSQSNASCLNSVSKILINTKVLGNSEGEVDVWLSSYFAMPEEDHKVVAANLVQCFRDVHSLVSKRSISSLDKAKAPSPLLTSALQLVQNHSETPSKKRSRRRLKTWQTYLSDVIANLMHYYNDKQCLIEICRPYKLVLPSTLTTFLESWMNCKPEDIDCNIFCRDSARNLAQWLFQRKEVDLTNVHFIGDAPQIFLMFKMAVFYLSQMAEADQLLEGDVDRLTPCLLTIFNYGLTIGNDDQKGLQSDVSCLSYNVKDGVALRKKCVSALLSTGSLSENFNVFERKKDSGRVCTEIIINVLTQIDTELIREYDSLLLPWKEQFLTQLTSKLRKCKSIKHKKLSVVLDLFQFTCEDIEKVLSGFYAVEDLDIFVAKGNRLSHWSAVLVKFVRLKAMSNYIAEDTVQLLTRLLQHLDNKENLDTADIDNCLVFVIERSPCCLLWIQNDFLEFTLRRKNINRFVEQCGKLLMNEPNKAQHLIEFATSHSGDLREWRMLFPMLSALITYDCDFLDVLRAQQACHLWADTEIPGDSQLSKVLEMAYLAYKSEVLQGVTEEPSSLIADNIDLARVLIRCFLQEKDALKMKKKLSTGEFHEGLAQEVIKKTQKEELIEKFVEGMMAKFCRILAPETAEEVWHTYSSMVEDLVVSFKNFDFTSLSESTSWKTFTHRSLKMCLDTKKQPALIKIIRTLIEAMCKEKSNAVDTSKIFSMVTSHSEFLNVMLRPTAIKCEITYLLHSLANMNPNVVSARHVPVLLAAYNAGLTSCDRILLRLLSFYEEHGVDTSQYQPYVWGEAAVDHYSVRSSSSLSLWHQRSMMSVLDLLDIKRVESTIQDFPLTRTLEFSDEGSYSNDVYDPAFLLPLFTSLLSPGAVPYCQAFIYKGGLALTICSLSSPCKMIRSAASVVLARLYNHLELTQNMKQKPIWLHFIDSIRYGINDLAHSPVPSVVSVFLARTSLELSNPLGEMYSPLHSYVLVRPCFNVNTVPEFLPLFHSSNVNFLKHRQWILEVMRDGLRQEIDLNVVFRSMSVKIILSFFNSSLCNQEFKILTLEVVRSLMRPKNGILLITEYGLLSWLDRVCFNPSPLLLEPIVLLISSVINLLKRSHQEKAIKQVDATQVIQLINITFKILPQFTEDSSSIFHTHLTSVQDLLIFFLREWKKDFTISDQGRLKDLIEVGVKIFGPESDCWKFTKTNFFFRGFTTNCLKISLKNAVYFCMYATK